jgi:hypothetical protein
LKKSFKFKKFKFKKGFKFKKLKELSEDRTKFKTTKSKSLFDLCTLWGLSRRRERIKYFIAHKHMRAAVVRANLVN